MLRQYTRLAWTRHRDPLRPLALPAAALTATAQAALPRRPPTRASHAHLYTTATVTDPPPTRNRIRANLFQLRPYQQACIDAVLSELEQGEFTRLGVSAPTGSGKTAIFTSLIGQIPPRRHPLQSGQEARQVLVVVNSIQLASQTAEAIQRAYPDSVRSPLPPTKLPHRLTVIPPFCRLSRSSRARAARPVSQTSQSPPSKSVLSVPP